MRELVLERDSIWERIIQPHSAVSDPDQHARARLLAAFTLGLTTLTLLMSVVYFLIFGSLEPELWLGASLFFLIFLLSRSPYPQVGDYAVVIGVTAIVALILLSRGAETQNLIWIMLPILLGAVLLPMWAAFAVSLFNISISLIILLSTQQVSLGIMFSIIFFIIFNAAITLATKHARQRDQEMLQQQSQALARSGARYKQLFDDVPVGLFESTADGEILKANQAMRQILRFPDWAALHTISAPELYVNPAEREKWLELAGTPGSLDEFEVELIGGDGQRIWVREQVRVVRNQAGEVSHFRGSIEDVTQRRWLQNQLTEQHQKLQMILGAMPNVLLVVDKQNRLKALYLPSDFPLPLDQRWAVTMENLIDVLPPQLTAQVQSSIETVRQTGVGSSFEQAVRMNGSDQTSYLRLKLSPVKETGDIIIVVDDLTELKAAEEKVRAYAAELEERNAELDAFSHTVAHDLRRPLTHVVSYAEMIRRYHGDELTEETAEFLLRIERAAMNMSEMIQNLLLLAQMREADQVVERVPMSGLVDSALRRTQLDIEKRGIRVEVQQPIPDALGYGPWLEEVFANLINNAVQYIGQDNPAPAITIRAVTLDGRVRYEVVDNGLGIAPEHQPRLFDMLTRFHTSESSGTGLGLSIVQRIINKLGGTVGLESQPGCGSTFWFTLPL